MQLISKANFTGMNIIPQAIERYANNIDKPMRCAGFYLNTAIAERIYLGYNIESVKLVDSIGSNRDTDTFEIIHN